MSRRLVASLSALASLACALVLLAPACASAEAEHPARTRQSAADLAPSQTYEVRFGSELVGYLIEVLPAAAGAPDTRAYEPGTAVIADLKHTLLGYISPRGTTYRFDAAGQAHTVGFGSRSTSIAAFFLKNDPPTLTPIGG
jgi:hypothetical protein